MFAFDGIHYRLCIQNGNIVGFDYTYEGLQELSYLQRKMIETAFFTHQLGTVFVFKDTAIPIEDYDPQPYFPEDDEIESMLLIGPCEWEYDWRQDAVLADKLYEEQKSRKWRGLYYDPS